MKLIAQNLIAKLKDYYKISPRVTAFVLTESEWTSLCEWDDSCIRIRIKHGNKAPIVKSSHESIGGLALKDWSALYANRRKNGHFWLAGKQFPKLPKYFARVNIADYDHLIFIRLARAIEKECSPCKVKDICPNLLGYLTHEFIHIVEYEQGTTILSEKPDAYYRYVYALLKEIFRNELDIAERVESGRDARLRF